MTLPKGAVETPLPTSDAPGTGAAELPPPRRGCAQGVSKVTVTEV
jgi:hypothetical protein